MQIRLVCVYGQCKNIAWASPSRLDSTNKNILFELSEFITFWIVANKFQDDISQQL